MGNDFKNAINKFCDLLRHDGFEFEDLKSNHDFNDKNFDVTSIKKILDKLALNKKNDNLINLTQRNAVYFIESLITLYNKSKKEIEKHPITFALYDTSDPFFTFRNVWAFDKQAEEKNQIILNNMFAAIVCLAIVGLREFQYDDIAKAVSAQYLNNKPEPLDKAEKQFWGLLKLHEKLEWGDSDKFDNYEDALQFSESSSTGTDDSTENDEGTGTDRNTNKGHKKNHI